MGPCRFSCDMGGASPWTPAHGAHAVGPLTLGHRPADIFSAAPRLRAQGSKGRRRRQRRGACSAPFQPRQARGHFRSATGATCQAAPLRARALRSCHCCFRVACRIVFSTCWRRGAALGRGCWLGGAGLARACAKCGGSGATRVCRGSANRPAWDALFKQDARSLQLPCAPHLGAPLQPRGSAPTSRRPPDLPPTFEREKARARRPARPTAPRVSPPQPTQPNKPAITGVCPLNPVHLVRWVPSQRGGCAWPRAPRGRRVRGPRGCGLAIRPGMYLTH
jgi:hypothetical protein